MLIKLRTFIQLSTWRAEPTKFSSVSWENRFDTDIAKHREGRSKTLTKSNFSKTRQDNFLQDKTRLIFRGFHHYCCYSSPWCSRKHYRCYGKGIRYWICCPHFSFSSQCILRKCFGQNWRNLYQRVCWYLYRSCWCHYWCYASILFGALTMLSETTET